MDFQDRFETIKEIFEMTVGGIFLIAALVFMGWILYHWWPILLHLAALVAMILLLGGINAVCKSGGMVITVPRKNKKDD